jgi:hypothetical protein
MLRTMLALALILLLAACSSGNATPTLAPTTTGTDQEIPDTASEPGATSASAATDIAPSPTRQPEAADLERLLGLVPRDSAGEVIWLSNRGHAREVYGLEGVDLVAHLESLPPEEVLGFDTSPIMAGIPSYGRHWRGAEGAMQESVGFSPLTFDRGIWSDSRHRPVGQPPSGDFFIGQGSLDEERVSAALASLGHYEAEHRGIEYLRNPLDDLQHGLSLPVGMRFGQMNRVFLEDDRLAVSNSTDRLTALIDLQVEDAPSTLADSVPHSSLVRQLGGNTIGLAFLPPRLVQELQQGLRRETIPNDDYGPFFYERYQDWGQLHPFDLAAVGYRAGGQGTQLVVALYYPNPEAAAADAAEFERRWEEYYLDLVLWRRPIAELCSSFLTYPVRLDDGSVLTAVCDLAEPGPDSDPRRDIRPAICHNMVEWEDLLFLVPDPQEYPAPDCGGKFNPVPSRPDIPASVLFKVFCEGSPSASGSSRRTWTRIFRERPCIRRYADRDHQLRNCRKKCQQPSQLTLRNPLPSFGTQRPLPCPSWASESGVRPSLAPDFRPLGREVRQHWAGWRGLPGRHRIRGEGTTYRRWASQERGSALRRVCRLGRPATADRNLLQRR